MSHRVLVVAPLPPPVTGQALAVKAVVDDLVTDCTVDVVDTMKGHYRHGFTSLTHGLRMLEAATTVRRQVGGSDAVYMSPSQTVVGNVKDLLFLAAMGRHRRTATLHLHGGGIHHTVFGRSRLLDGLNRRLLGGVKAVIVSGDSLRDVYGDFVPPERIHTVANFAADDLYVEPDEIRRRFDERGPLHVVFLGVLFASKGVPELLAAVEKLDRSGEGAAVHVTVAGPEVEGEVDIDSWRDRVPRVSFVGEVDADERRRLLQSSHVLCLPTSYPYEGQPLVILEAYAAGCAVVTTDHAGIPDVFTPGQNGIGIPAGDSEAVAGALLALAKDRAAACGHALRNRNRADEFTREAHVAAVRRVLLS
jgi:glycosyltransferase involved in cell wall biosynthesis